MVNRALYDIVTECGRAVAKLIREMEGEDELFASALTLRAVEHQLFTMAHTLGNVPPLLRDKLTPVDWNGWHVLHDKLRRGVQPRREEIWYAVNGLVPQTLDLLKALRQRQPVLFEIGY